MSDTTNIYALLDPLTLEIRFIGKSKKTDKIVSDIISEKNLSKNTEKNEWIRPLVARKLIPVLKILEECPNDLANDKKKEWENQVTRLNHLNKRKNSPVGTFVIIYNDGRIERTLDKSKFCAENGLHIINDFHNMFSKKRTSRKMIELGIVSIERIL